MVTRPVSPFPMLVVPCSGLKTKIVANGLQGLMFSVSCLCTFVLWFVSAGCELGMRLAGVVVHSCCHGLSTACSCYASSLVQVLWRLGQDYMARTSGGS